MNVSRFSKAARIPKVSTQKSAPTTTNFSKGWNTYLPNDLLEYEQIRLAQNVRFDKIGEYKTRRGLKSLVAPETEDLVDTLSASIADMVEIDGEVTIPFDSHVIRRHQAIYSVELLIQAVDDSYGIPQLTASHSTEKDMTCASFDTFDSSAPTVVEFDFKDGKVSANDSLTISLKAQSGNKRFLIAVDPTTGIPLCRIRCATLGKIVGLFEANINGEYFILYAAEIYPSNAVTNNKVLQIVAINPNGSRQTIYSKSVSSLQNYKGRVRFSQNLDEVRCVWGDKPQKLTVTKITFIVTTYDWAINAIDPTDLQTGEPLDIKTSNILTGTNDNIMYFDAETDTQAVWTNPYGLEYAKPADYTTSADIPAFVVGETTTALISTSTLEATSDTHLVDAIAVNDIIVDSNDDYGKVTEIVGQNVTVEAFSHVAEAINTLDSFDRDFRQNFPSIKTGDPLTAMFNLGGVIYFLTRRNKYYLYSQTADVWTQHAASAQHGTFSQESVACDLNYAYYACDDGVYIFNGSTEYSLTDKTVQDFYDQIPNKENIVLELYNNRLYVFYPSTKTGDNDSCLVYNINLKVWESVDTGLPVNATIGRQSPSSRFICGSSKFAQLFLYESASTAVNAEKYGKDYADLGAPIFVELATGFLHFGTPSQLHRITKWRPEFQVTEFPYMVRCGYSLDFSNKVDYAFSINLKDSTAWNEGTDEWDTSEVYGLINNGIPTKLTTIPKVYDQFRRCQIRYQHFAAFEPINFKSHTLCCQTQRIR